MLCSNWKLNRFNVPICRQSVATAALTLINPQRTLEGTMQAGFDAVRRMRLKIFCAAKGKGLGVDFGANKKFHLFPAFDGEPIWTC